MKIASLAFSGRLEKGSRLFRSWAVLFIVEAAADVIGAVVVVCLCFLVWFEFISRDPF